MPTSESRRPLDRSRVVAAAVRTADEAGLAALSMRSLATRLGVVPMALYKHVADKEDLLDGMVDTIVRDYADPPAEAGWRVALRHRVHTARAALEEHPWLRPAIESRRRRSAAVLGYQDAVTGDLLAGGLSVDLTHHALHALGTRIWGFTAEAFDAPEPPAVVEVEPAEQEATMRMMAERFPHIAAVALDSARRSGGAGCDAEEEFDFTLELLLDAIERLHAAGWESPARQPSGG